MIILKIILWVILAIILLVLLALCFPVRVNVRYSNDVKIKIKYLFLSFTVFPEGEKKKKGKDKKKSKKTENNKDERENTEETTEGNTESPKEDEIPSREKKRGKKKKKENKTWRQIKDLYKQNGLDGFLTLITESTELVTGTLGNLKKHTVLKQFRANIVVATGDAADTAVKYGYVCAVVYPCVSLVLNSVKYKKYTVDIAPNFDKKESEIDFEAEASAISWFVVIEIVKALISLVKIKYKLKLSE